MKQIWKGKLKLRIKKEYPFYGTTYRHLYKVLFYKWGWSISIWIEHKDSSSGELSDWVIDKLNKVFPGCEIKENRYVTWNGHYISPSELSFIFDDKCDFVGTENPQVLFDRKSQKYVGYSHRAIAEFGIGDMLFNQSGKIGVNVKEDINSYYKNPKYRWEFIKTLLKYHFKDDWLAFKDLCEDETIGHGIKTIVPYNKRGLKKIETLDEACQAAINFADYVS